MDTDEEFYRIMLEMRKQEVRDRMAALESAIETFESTFDKDQL